MITAGRNITSSSDLLVQLDVSQLVKSLKYPKEEVKKLIEQMRTYISTLLLIAIFCLAVPEILNYILEDINSFIMDSGLELIEEISIQYGKKFFMYQDKEAETNLYYGKKGFSVVETPRSGTDAELIELMADMVSTYVNTL